MITTVKFQCAYLQIFPITNVDLFCTYYFVSIFYHLALPDIILPLMLSVLWKCYFRWLHSIPLCGCHNYSPYMLSCLDCFLLPPLLPYINNTEMNMFVQKYLCTHLIWGGAEFWGTQCDKPLWPGLSPPRKEGWGALVTPRLPEQGFWGYPKK